VKLTVYLFQDHLATADQAIREAYTERLVAVLPTQPLPYDCNAYVLPTHPSPPRWLKFLGGHFDLNVRNQGSGFVLVIPLDGRLMAVTFGFGHQAIDRSVVEPNFGLRVVANTVDPEQLRTIDARNIDVVTRQQKIQLSVGGTLTEFELEPIRDWVRYLAGRPPRADDGVATSLSGSDSLSANVRWTVRDAATQCRRLLELFRSTRYREYFEFIDYHRPLDRSDPLIEELESELTERLINQSAERINIAPMEVVDDDRIDLWHFTGGRHGLSYDELSLATLFAFLTATPGLEHPLQQIHVHAKDADGAVVSRRATLRQYLVAEIQRGDKTYVLSLGHWFEVDTTYIGKLHRQLAELADVTDELALPAWGPKEVEKDYNVRVAAAKGWASLDRKAIDLGRYQRVEVCDLLTPDHRLICVKRASSSSTLSHLFSQGSVAADLLADSPEFFTKVEEQLRIQGDIAVPSRSEGTFVYAIGTNSTEPLASSLFFFSKVNLLQHARLIRRLGYRVAIARIAM